MLKGEKVLLRAVQREDLPLLCAFNNDLELELAGGGDPPLPQSLARLQAEFDERTAKGGRDGAAFAIEAAGQLIGQCALFSFHEMNQTCELGIGIGEKTFWGRGYGSETIRLLLDWAFRLRNVRKVWLTTQSNNERGLLCYRACGFVEEGRLRAHVWSAGEYVDLLYMGILRDEWQKSSSPSKVPEARDQQT